MARVYLEKLNLDTAKEVKLWENFTDERLQGYNYADLSDFEIKVWYGSLTSPLKKYFAVRKIDDDRFIGFLGLKQINYLKKKAKIGVVFDSAYTSRGYGLEGLDLLIDKAFSNMKFKELSLDVNLFNTRAIATYKKLGFQITGEKKEVFENQGIKFDERYFTKEAGIIYSKILEMKLTKDDYYGL